MPDDELDRLRADVVEPVTRSILRDDELESVELWREGREIQVRVVARGETFHDLLSDPTWSGFEHTAPQPIAERLADHLERRVCETRFACGERRTADPTARR